MKIFIDISNLMDVHFTTGIQRVVMEYSVELIRRELDVVFLQWDQCKKKYRVVSKNNVLSRAGKQMSYIDEDLGDKHFWDFNVNCDASNCIFLDLDAVWNRGCLPRGWLYLELKKAGIKIVTFVHDVIPALCIKYCHPDTVYRFIDYLAATIKYADVLLTYTNSTRNEIEKCVEKCGLKKRIEVVGGGADFREYNENVSTTLREDVLEAVKAGKYILNVSTLEPRKNQAFLLDCLEEYLMDVDINLVIAGRIGWKIKEFEDRLRNHKLLGKRIFFIEGADDDNIRFLYKNAFLFAFPSHQEGYGIPIMEAMYYKVPVLASDISVFREIGSVYCDYFSLENPYEMARIVKGYLEDKEKYEKRQNQLDGYKFPRWKDAVNKAVSVLGSISMESKFNVKLNVRQIYMLTARPQETIETLAYIEKYIPFIDKVLLGMPETATVQVNREYDGNLQIEFLTDEELLQGAPLPEDHLTRNFLLRCLAMKSEKLDDVFIMYDDDYHPLVEIKREDFIRENRYIGYYFYDLRYWGGTMYRPTSFDRAMNRTLEFLQKNALPTLQFSAHIPQVVDKRIFREILTMYPGIELKGYCEWSIYFNYAMSKYPGCFIKEKYKSLCWPGLTTDWKLLCLPEEYLFENFYQELYQNHDLQGLPTKMVPQSSRSIMKKVLRKHTEYFSALMYQHMDKIMQQYTRWVKKDEMSPLSCILSYNKEKEQIEFYGTKYFFAPSRFCIYWMIKMVGFEEFTEEEWDLEAVYRFDPIETDGIVWMEKHSVAYGLPCAALPIFAPVKPGYYKLYVWFESKTLRSKSVVAADAWIYNKVDIDKDVI